MKNQNYNEGDLSNLEVKIEKRLAEDLEIMSKNSGLSVDDLVAVAVKRFRASHADYMGINLDYP